MHPRLIGVETEYALAWVPSQPGGRSPLPREIYALVESAVRARVEALPSAGPKGGVFLATGGLLHYESPMSHFARGLLEMATPECRGPLEAARYHHAQDGLLAQVHAEVEFQLRARGFEGELVIGKASADAAGNVWGSHENYEVDDPAGFLRTLLLLAAFPAFWIPAVLVGWGARLAVNAVLVAAVVAYRLLGILGRLPGLSRPCAAGQEALVSAGRRAFGEESLLRIARLTGLATLPWVRAYDAVLRAAVAPAARRALLPHLVSRLVFAGAGRVSPDGARFSLSQKAPAIRRAAGTFWDDAERPVFDLKNFVREPWSVWGRRKRLQVLFADSNTSRLATALRLGTTDLVLRMIEAGHPLRDLAPRDVRQAIAAVDGDPTLAAKIALADGTEMTALEMQRYFLGEAEKFCGKNAEPETAEILAKWRYVLDALAEDPHLLFKDLDWVAKRDLVGEALAAEGGWKAVAADPALAAAACKIDARFHEIGPRGYGETLLAAGRTREYFARPELERAAREPASSPRARARGEAVRRHSGDDREARVTWAELLLRHPRERVRL